MKSSKIGGQAVIEGVMMKNGGKYAVAVRRPDGKIDVCVKPCTDGSKRTGFLGLPIIRGVAAFIDSLVIGMNTLSYSASFFEEEGEQSAFEKRLNKITKGHADNIINGITMFFSIILALGIFVLAPTFIANMLEKVIKNGVLVGFIEGVIRVAIFVLYIFLISLLKDIKRLFMYHGAEHKVINCIENGFELNIENVRGASREHRRCGTAFMLNVMLLSILFFMVIRVDQLWLKLVLRLILIPIIAGLSYEFIQATGKRNGKLSAILSKPGLLMQALTTREPEDEMIEVAIASVDAVFDWKTFVDEVNGKNAKKQKKSKKKHEKKEQKHDENIIAAASASVEEVKQDTAPKATEAPEVKETEPENKETGAAESTAYQPLEVDISKLFDIKLPEVDESKTKKKKLKDKVKAENTESPASAPVKGIEDDDILKALDFMFEFDGPKTEIEISDDPNVVVTGPEDK